MPTARATLAAEHRDVTGKKVAGLRHAGKLPAVVYGHGIDSASVSVDAHDFEQLRRHSGPNALVDLSIDGEQYWDASLVEPAGSVVAPGFWANLPGYTGANGPALRFFGEGRSCISGSVNRFAVDEVTYANGSLQSLTARFEQRK